MLKRFLDVLINKFDHFVFHHKLGSIFMTFLFIVAVFIGFFILKPENAEEDKSSFGYLIGIFTQGLLNWPEKETDYDTYLLFLSITGSFLLSGFFYAVIANALIGRSDVYKDGKLRYKLSNHTVILGSNSLLESTLDYLNKKEKFKKEESWFPKERKHNILFHLYITARHKWFCNYIVVVSSHKPNTIRNRANRYGYIRNHVLVYNDELDDDKVFKKIYLNKAKEVFVLGDEEPKISDALNVKLVNMIINSVKESSRCGKRLLCNVSYFNPNLLMAALSGIENTRERPDNIEIQPYNYLDGCLSFYWGNKCVERMFSNNCRTEPEGNIFSLMPTNGRGYHFVIVGFNDLTCCCVRKICSLAHFGKEAKTIITMITNAKQRFQYFCEELAVDNMPDITLECVASLDEFEKEEGKDEALRYYVVATADATMDNMLINHLSLYKHACLLGYAEDYDQEIDTNIKYFTTKEQHLGYWGFKKLRTHINTGKQEYNHARLLYEAHNSLTNNNKDFIQLNPMQQKAWMDFYNYLYYLIQVSGCKLQSRAKIDKKGKTKKEIIAESQEQRLLAKENTLLSMKLVHDKIDSAILNYKTAQMALHRGESVSATHYQEQLNNICDNYRNIVALYLAKANESGIQLVV